MEQDFPEVKKPTFSESVVTATQEVTAKDWCWIATDLIVIIYAFFIMMPLIKQVDKSKLGVYYKTVAEHLLQRLRRPKAGHEAVQDDGGGS